MAERLAARGYPVTDAQGYGENPMLDALDRSLRGETVKAPDGMEADIAAAAAERDAMQAHEAPLLADHEYAGLDSPNQQRLLDAAVRARLDVPVTHVNASYVRSHFDSMEVGLNDSPRADEMLVVLVMTTGPRVHSRSGGLEAAEIKGEDGLR